MKEKIHGGKLALSLLIFIVGGTLISFAVAYILLLLLQIPFIRGVLSFMTNGDGIHVGLASTIIATIICYGITAKINENTERTHLLSIMIFGILFLILHVFSLILNIIYGNAIFMNIVGIIMGIGCIVHGSSFKK